MKNQDAFVRLVDVSVSGNLFRTECPELYISDDGIDRRGRRMSPCLQYIYIYVRLFSYHAVGPFLGSTVRNRVWGSGDILPAPPAPVREKTVLAGAIYVHDGARWRITQFGSDVNKADAKISTNSLPISAREHSRIKYGRAIHLRVLSVPAEGYRSVRRSPPDFS